MIAAEEVVAIPRRGLFTRAWRGRQEDAPRLSERTLFDRSHPWSRAAVGNELGHARQSDAEPAGFARFVPDDGEERLVQSCALRVRASQAKADVAARRAARQKARRRARRRAA